jgi:hypothetical protein
MGYDTEAEYRLQRDIYVSDAEYVSRWYRWTEWGQRFDDWVMSSLPDSGPAWLADHRLRRPRQHARFFDAMDRLRSHQMPSGAAEE